MGTEQKPESSLSWIKLMVQEMQEAAINQIVSQTIEVITANSEWQQF